MRESGENYLETIYLLSKEQKKVRSIDVANYLDVTKASVSRAMGLMRERGYLENSEGTSLVLTQEGIKLAKKLVEKRECLAKFLEMTTDISAEIATKDANNMYHYMSDETVKGMKKFIKEVEEYNDEN